ncbi:MAG: hypothetical protein WBN07_09930, partial [Woeseiaceae bacterium]
MSSTVRKQCAQCNEFFETQYLSKLYCRPECQIQASNDRKRIREGKPLAREPQRTLSDYVCPITG